MSLLALKPRVLATVLLAGAVALMLVAGMAGAAVAVEDDVPDAEELEQPPPPDIEELCREGTIAAEFCPEVYEEPSWFQWMIYPLLIVGLVMVTIMLIAYLVWQPRFAREHAEKLRRR